MNATTPPKEIPPDHRTAASGTFPIEQTKLSTAITGPAITFSIVRTAAGASVTNSPLKKSLPSRPPPMNSARVNCQPISTQRTKPSSQTRLVDANWKARAVTAEAPLANSDLAIAIAAYEHDDEAAPRPVARATGPNPSPESAAS